MKIIRGRGAGAPSEALRGGGSSNSLPPTKSFGGIGFRLAHGSPYLQAVYGWCGTPVGPPSSLIARTPGRVDQRLGFRLVWSREEA